jgi:AmmeMemoRadiSam system protein B
VQEGKAIPLPLYKILALLNGIITIRDLQAELMRQQGGALVGTDEIKGLIAHLDESFLLDSDRFRAAKDKIVADFTSKKIRPCSHDGGAYPENPLELKKRLDEILASRPPVSGPEGKVKALVAPHIDLSVGYRVYSSAYQMLRFVKPARILVLGIGHQMVDHMFCLTDKGFDTPLGVVQNDPDCIRELQSAGGDILADNDFAHRTEHSIEFQAVFLRHLLGEESFTIAPVLCGSLQTTLPEYSRDAYLDRAGPFLEKLKEILDDPENETILVAGVDFSHIGPKFGHEMPAMHLKRQSESHDRNLLEHLSGLDAEHFWEESKAVNDQYNVCGFSALACLLETMPDCRGKILDYELWNEEATRSAVSFAAVVFAV